MSLLVQVMQQPRLVDGEVKELGETARLPNSLAIALKKKGFAIDASGEAHLKEAAANVAQRKAYQAIQDEAAELKRKKKGRN